jgi:phosphatidate phosphatase APP1
VQSAEDHKAQFESGRPLSLEERVRENKNAALTAKNAKREYESKIRTIAVQRAGQYLDSYARLTLTDGRIRTGVIADVDDTAITLQKSYGKSAKGVMAYSVALAKIAKLDVLD